MKGKYFVYLKAMMVFTAVGMSLWLFGCGGEPAPEASAAILKDGSVSARIVESFDKSYYDGEELKQKILMEAANYNKEAGGDCISVKKVSVEEPMVVVEMTYADPEAYGRFNGGVFFLGSPGEAEEAGFDLNVVLSGAEDPLETVGRSDILAMEDSTLLITDMTEPVTLNGKALYVSEGVIVSKNLKTVSFQEEGGRPAYILYQ